MRIRTELFLATLVLVSFVTLGMAIPPGYGHVGTRNKQCAALIASKMLKRKNDPSSTIHFKFAGQPVSGTNVELRPFQFPKESRRWATKVSSGTGQSSSRSS